MKYSKIIIVCALLILGASTIFAQNALVSFMDNTSQTRDYLNMEYPGGSYPAGAGTAANRWKLVIYKSTDNIINPLVNGLPTGDDVILTNPQDNNNPVILDVNIAPGPSGKLNLNAVVVHVSIIPTYIYGRIFNSVDVSTATKYMTFTAPYYVAAGQPVNVDIIPNYGWKTDPVWSPIFPVTDTWTYNLTITASDNGAYEFTDPQSGVHTTPATLTDGPGDEANSLLGTYTVTSAPPAGFQWQFTTIEVVAGDFIAGKTDYVYNAAKQFVLVPIPDTYTYNLHIAGPEGYVVTGPTAELSGTIPYTETASEVSALIGDYTVAAPPVGYQWVVNPIAVTPDMFSQVTKKNGGMDKVVLGSRNNGAKTNYVYEATITFVLEELPPQNYTVEITSDPAGAAIYVDGEPSGFTTPHTFTLAAGTDATYTVQMENYTWTPSNFVVTDIAANMSCNFVGTFTFTEGDVVTPPDVPTGATITIQLTGGNGIIIPGIPTPAINPSWIPGYIQFLTLLGTGPWQITINTSYPYVWVVGVGVYTGPFPMTIDIPAGAKDEDVELQFGEGGDPTLPVELSYFAATLTAENFVNIAWTTQTETNMNGFNIYRNDDSDVLAGAIQIAYIPATNTSTTQNYKHIDREVENGHTYYYWLECVETNGESTFNGPSPVYVDGPTPPVLPEYTIMHNAYPNPFRAGDGTTINVDVKAGDTGTVTIYNILGQVVKTVPVIQGKNDIFWNGRDSKGNLCGNGIYFYKLSTNSLNQTKKMVIVK